MPISFGQLVGRALFALSLGGGLGTLAGYLLGRGEARLPMMAIIGFLSALGCLGCVLRDVKYERGLMLVLLGPWGVLVLWVGLRQSLQIAAGTPADYGLLVACAVSVFLSALYLVWREQCRGVG